MLFLNQANPYFRIYIPETEGFAEFKGGRLELDEGDPAFETVKAEALRNPSIVILVDATTCALCGEVFTGKAAAAQLGKHRKDVHFGEWVAEKAGQQEDVLRREVKARQPHACDLCVRVQEFASAEDLAVHVRAVHIDTVVDDDGNVSGAGPDSGGGGATPTDPAEPPAAIVK